MSGAGAGGDAGGPEETRRKVPEGPGFMAPDAWPYRLEWAVGALSLVVIIAQSRNVLGTDLPLGWVAFWLVFPDLAFVPIGLGWKAAGGWPRWGAAAYNLTHSLLTWATVVAAWWVATGAVEWPLLGWAVHIAVDRAAGYWLRQGPSHPAWRER